MPAIVTFDSTKIDVDFNDIKAIVGIDGARIRSGALQYVTFYDKGGVEFIEAGVSETERPWQFTVDGLNDTIPIQSVNGVSPTDNAHLFTLLKEAIS